MNDSMVSSWPREVLKRSGLREAFNADKIRSALARAGQAALIQQPHQVVAYRGAAADQLFLGIDPPDRHMMAQVGDQLVVGPVLVGLVRPGRGKRWIAGAGDAEDAAFVVLLPVLPLDPVLGAPAQDV